MQSALGSMAFETSLSTIQSDVALIQSQEMHLQQSQRSALHFLEWTTHSGHIVFWLLRAQTMNRMTVCR